MSASPRKPAPPKILATVIAFVVVTALLASLFSSTQERILEIPYSEFEQMLESPAGEAGQFVEGIFQDDNYLVATRRDMSKIRTYVPNDVDTREILRERGLKLSFEPSEAGFWRDRVIPFLTILLVAGVCIMLLRSAGAGGGRAMSFGRSRAKMIHDFKPKVTFKDIAGIDEAKVELEEIIDFLREPKKFMRLGGRIPKGVILVGPPGTGKTILAKGVAGEAGVPFFSISGSDFVEMFVGVGASRVRDLFEQAKKNAPCIVFIDEIDAVGRHRGAGTGGGHDEREQTLNQLLVEMDGFEANEGVIVVAATNRVDVLDPALLRPGRFDRRVYVPAPDVKGRLEILHVHSKKTPLADDVDLALIAQATPGFTGADLENLINEAALVAARRNASEVTMDHCDFARDKVLMGAERKSMILSEEDKRATAYHEAGHALCAILAGDCDPIHKITIIPRGQALGVTTTLPKQDRLSITRTYAQSRIVHAMGGRAAEELVFGSRTSGVEDDIRQATDIARRMICNWGMSDDIGPLAIGDNPRQVFLGRAAAEGHTAVSEALACQVDTQIRQLLQEGYDKALQLLTAHRNELNAVSETLLIKETLTGAEIDRIMAGENLITADEIEAYRTRNERAKHWAKTLQSSVTSVNAAGPKHEMEPTT